MSTSDPVPRVSALAAPYLLSDRELEGLIVDARAEYNVGEAGRLDPRPGTCAVVDCGDIGQDGGGIWVRRAPEAMLLDAPRLWSAVERYRLGHHELRPEDADHLDALEHSALMAILDTHHRTVGRVIETRSKNREPGTFGGRKL